MEDRRVKLEKILTTLQTELQFSDAIIKTIRGLLLDWLRIH